MNAKDFVFISYSRKDRDFVDRLEKDLRAVGVQTWRDIDEISPGQNWESAISDAINRADVLLHVSSSNSVNSKWIHLELMAGISKKKKVIPVIIDDKGAEELPDYLQTIQWVDFREDYKSAFDQLINALPKLVQQDEPVQEQTQKSKGYVFISYADEDSHFVDKLKSFLATRDFAYWDYRESPRNYHILFCLELESVINEAIATLSILSPDWKRSKWAMREFFFSEEVEVPIFLLKARDIDPTLAIAGLPYIDFTTPDNDGFDRLDRELKRKGL